MTAAEAAAWLARPFQRAPIVATRHFPGGRGTGTVARVAGPGGRPAPSPVTSPSASSWPGGLPGPSVLLYNAVPDRPQADLDGAGGPDAPTG